VQKEESVNRQDVETLYEYEAWATKRALDASAALAPDQFVKDLRNSFPSIRDTLVHILNAEWIWLRRWQGESPRGGMAPADFPDVASVRNGFARVEAERRAFLAGVADGDLDRELVYRDLQGVERRLLLIQSLQHLVNHGTYHRGQVTTMLRQLGATPISTDLARFCLERKG
jgi:uncharacterized damage-inducible protein DinB